MPILNISTEEEAVGDDSEKVVEVSNIRFKINVSEASKALAKKLNREIARGHADLAFSIVIGLTLAKDLIGLIPIFGDVIALVVSGGIFIFMLGKGYFLKQRLWIWFWIINGIIAFIPFIDLTLVVSDPAIMFYAWYLVKKRMRKAENKLAILGQLTLQEMEQLNNNISLLDEEEADYYTSSGKLSSRSKELIRGAQRTIKKSGGYNRPATSQPVDGIKRMDDLKKKDRLNKADQTNLIGHEKAITREKLGLGIGEIVNGLEDNNIDEVAKKYVNKLGYVEFERKTGEMKPVESEGDNPEDWPIAV